MQLLICTSYYSPSMRPRHWKQLLKLAPSGTTHMLSRGGVFDISALEELTFRQLLDMRLHGEIDRQLLIIVQCGLTFHRFFVR